MKRSCCYYAVDEADEGLAEDMPGDIVMDPIYSQVTEKVGSICTPSISFAGIETDHSSSCGYMV